MPVIGPRPVGTPALQIRWRRRCLTKLAKQSIAVHLSTDEPDGMSVAPMHSTEDQRGNIRVLYWWARHLACRSISDRHGPAHHCIHPEFSTRDRLYVFLSRRLPSAAKWPFSSSPMRCRTSLLSWFSLLSEKRR